PMGSIGRRNLPCSTVKAHTLKSMGARFWSRTRASSRVAESFPPERATATRSPSRIILKRPTASPTLRSSVFSRSTGSIVPCCRGGAGGFQEPLIFLLRPDHHGQRLVEKFPVFAFIEQDSAHDFHFSWSY